MAFATLPHLRLAWDSYAGGDIFVQYNVYRRRRLSLLDDRSLKSDHLTLSGNEITDAVRATGTEGDGRTVPDSSVGIWGAATNLIQNGGLETGTAHWVAQGGASISRATATAKFGSASLQVDAANASASGCRAHMGAGDKMSVTAGQQYAVSLWARLDSAGAQSLNLVIDWHDAGEVWLSNSVQAITLNSSGWTRFSFTATAPGSAALAGISFNTSGAQGVFTFHVDGAQFEAGPIATPYVETDGGTASRSAARVQLPAAGLFTETRGWAAFRLRMGADSSDYTGGSSGEPAVLTWGGGSDYIHLRHDSSASNWQAVRSATAGSQAVNAAGAFSLGDLVTVFMYWDANGVGLSLAGGAFTIATGTDIPSISATLLDIGSGFGGGAARFLDGDVLWAVFGSGTPTDADAALLDGFGDTDPSPNDLAALSAGAYPTVIWTGEDADAWVVVEEAWVRIARIAAVEHPRYDDYTAAGGQSYEYAVTQSVTIGGSTLESAKQSPPPQGTVSFRPGFLHEWGDPTVYAELRGRGVAVDPRQEIAYDRARGRAQPTAHAGIGLGHEIAVELMAEELSDRLLWETLRQMQGDQFSDGAVLVFRPGHAAGERYFVALDGLTRDDRSAGYAPALRLREQYVDEAV